MKLKGNLVVGVLVAFTAASGGAIAADDNMGTANAATTETFKSAPSAQKTTTVTKAKPHSHVQEKSGVAPSTLPAMTAEEKAAKSKMHQHSRDAK